MVILYNFKNKLDGQPDYAVFDFNQSHAIIATLNDALLVDLKNMQELDID